MANGQQQHKPWRMCAVCRERALKHDLGRYILKEGRPESDPQYLLPGRGIYVCAKPECAERFSKIKKFSRTRKGD